MAIRDFIILGFLVVSLPLCFIRPFYGVILWTIFAFLNPHRYAYGARDLPVAMAIAIATLVGVLLFTRDWRPFFSKGMVWFLVLWLWFTLTTIISVNTPLFIPHSADTWLRWREVSKMLLMTFVALGVVNNWSRFRWFILAICGSFGVLVVKLLPMMIFTGGAARIYGPDNTMIADNNDLGLALNMTLPMFFFLAKTEENRRMRILMWFLFLATIPAIFFTYSRGAFVGLVVISGLMIFRSKRSLMLLPVAGLVVLFALVLAPQAWRDRMGTVIGGNLDGSALGRINAWKFAISLSSEFPITGGGFESFTPELFRRYAPNPGDVHGPHSIYFGILGEHGWIGLILYALFITACFVRLHRVIRSAKLTGDQQIENYARMLQFSLIAFLVSGSFLGRAYFDYFFMIVACTVVLARLWDIDRARWMDSAELDEISPQEEMQADTEAETAMSEV